MNVPIVSPSIFQPGDVCAGSYLIERLATSSHVAETYLARRTVTRQQAILTCSRFDHVVGDAPSIEAFNASAEKLQKLAIDPVPKIYDHGVHEGVFWIAWQVLDDPTILEAHTRMDGKPGSWFVEDSLSALLSIAEILSAASASGVVHGNLRPDLIVLRGLPNSSDPHLLELGFADLFMLTRETARMAPRYHSPEQLEGARVDARSDIYALGMCLYELIAKAPPYADKAPDSNSAALLEMALRELPTALPALVTYCPDFVWRVIAKAIDKDPEKRFQALGDFREAISAALDQVMALRDPVNLADLGIEGHELVKAFRAYQEAHRGAKGEATEATDTPRTLPPGIDTKRRVRAALAEARASVQEDPVPRIAATAPAPPPVALPAPPPLIAKDGLRDEPAPLTGTSPESLSTAPTPRLPVNPARARQTIPAEALPAVASASTSASIAAPITVRVVAPLAAPIVIPAEAAMPPVDTRASMPSTPTRAEGVTSGRPGPRSIRWAASASIAMLVGLVGLRAVLLLEDRADDADSSGEKARHWLAAPQCSVNGEATRVQPLVPAPSLTGADPYVRRSQRPVARNANGVIDWLTSMRTGNPPQKAQEEAK